MPYWVAGSDSWNGTDGAKWGSASGVVDSVAKPTSTTDALFDANSGIVSPPVTVTLASGHTGCRNLNFTGVPAGFTFAGSGTFIAANSIFGGLTLDANMTWTYSASTITFAATSGLHSINTAGVPINNGFTFNGVGGSWQLTGNLVSGATRTLTVTNGSFDFNDFDCTVGLLSSSNANIRTLRLGNGTITLNATSGSVIALTTTTNLTFDAEGSTVLVDADTTSARTIACGGLTFNVLELAGPGTGDFNITTDLTAATFRISDAPQEIVVTAGVTITVSELSINGTAGNLNVFTSATPGTPWVLAKTGGGILSVDYVTLTDCHPPEGTVVYAGVHCTDGGGNNERVIFSAVSGAGLSIPSNGRIVTNPANLYVMETYADAATDLDELRTFATNNSIFADINMSLDWKLREWDMIQTAVAWVAAHFHWIGISSLGGRPIEMLDTLATDGHLLAWGSSDPHGVVSAIGALSPAYRYTRVVAGEDFAAALDGEGDIYMFGTARPAVSILSGFGRYFTDFACGAHHIVAVKDNGVVATDGDNTDGQCESPDGDGSVLAVAAGDTFSAYLIDDGTVEVVGTISSDVAYNSAWDGQFVQITAAGGHILGLLDDGSVVAWGENGDGQCTVPDLTGKTVLNLFADATRSYVAYQLANGNQGIQSWGKSITLGAVASNVSGFASSSMNYIISPNVLLPQTVTIAGDAGDMPADALPTLPTDTTWVSFAGGDRFGVGIAHKVWPCGSITRSLQGLLQAHGIPARHISGVAPDASCASDRTLEVWSAAYNKWILIWPQSGYWVEDANGEPQSYAEVRAHGDAGNYQIIDGYEIGKKGRGHKAVAANGSGLVFMPGAIATPDLFPHTPLDWWSGRLKTTPAAGDLFDYGQTTSTSKVNTNPASTSTVYFQAINACSFDSTGEPVAAEDDDDISYPLNQVYARAELTGTEPPTVTITLTNNMTNGTGGVLDHYDASVDGGTTWAEISTVLTDEGGGVYTWLPVGISSIMIRGENDGAGAHSPDVEITYAPTTALSRGTMLLRGRTDTPWRRFGRM